MGSLALVPTRGVTQVGPRYIWHELAGPAQLPIFPVRADPTFLAPGEDFVVTGQGRSGATTNNGFGEPVVVEKAGRFSLLLSPDDKRYALPSKPTQVASSSGGSYLVLFVDGSVSQFAFDAANKLIETKLPILGVVQNISSGFDGVLDSPTYAQFIFSAVTADGRLYTWLAFRRHSVVALNLYQPALRDLGVGPVRDFVSFGVTSWAVTATGELVGWGAHELLVIPLHQKRQSSNACAT